MGQSLFRPAVSAVMAVAVAMFVTENGRAQSAQPQSPSIAQVVAANGAGHGNGYRDSRMSGHSHLLKVTRRAGHLTLETSTTGKEWYSSEEWEKSLPDECTVNLYAQHSSDKGGTVTFSDFAISPLPKEEKK